MKNVYVGYKCRTCKKEFVLLCEDVEMQEKINRYLTCPYCNSKRVSKQKSTDGLKECMKAHSYKRKNGALEQVK